MGLADASKLEKCTGFIDVNGLKGPNKIVTCNDGEGNSDNCQVTNPTDIYPVVYFDQTVEPRFRSCKSCIVWQINNFYKSNLFVRPEIFSRRSFSCSVPLYTPSLIREGRGWGRG